MLQDFTRFGNVKFQSICAMLTEFAMSGRSNSYSMPKQKAAEFTMYKWLIRNSIWNFILFHALCVYIHHEIVSEHRAQHNCDGVRKTPYNKLNKNTAHKYFMKR